MEMLAVLLVIPCHILPQGDDGFCYVDEVSVRYVLHVLCPVLVIRLGSLSGYLLQVDLAEGDSMVGLVCWVLGVEVIHDPVQVCVMK